MGHGKPAGFATSLQRKESKDAVFAALEITILFEVLAAQKNWISH